MATFVVTSPDGFTVTFLVMGLLIDPGFCLTLDFD